MASKKEDYVCLSAMLRAREPKMLTYAKAAAMADSDDFAEAARQLTECGYPDMSQMNASEINDALYAHRAALFEEIKRLSPDGEIVDVFGIKYDYHNIKTILKADAVQQDPSRLFSRSGRFNPDKLLADVREEQLQDYPETFVQAAKEAAEMLSGSGNPQKADFILDRAYFQELSALAEKLDSPFFTAYIKALIDGANLRTVVRTFRMGRSAEFMEDAVAEGGSVPADRLTGLADASSLAELFSASAMAAPAKLAADAAEQGNLTTFEKACDDAVTALLRETRYVNYGPETVIVYLSALESETTAARMILTGLRAGVKGSVIKERLRDMYA